jgi:alcohol dehydrogenase class IV
MKAGSVDRIRTPLKNEGVEVEVFGKVEAEPLVRVVDECSEFIRKGKYDLIVGLGGGSSLDTAKAAAIMGTRQGSVREICGMALAYPIGTEFHQNHGRSNGIVLPHVMEFNIIGNIRKYGIIGSTMGENIQGLNGLEAAERSVLTGKRLLEMIHFSYRLRDYGIPKESIPKLVEGGMKQSRLFVPNPRNLTQEDVTAIYTKAW